MTPRHAPEQLLDGLRAAAAWAGRRHLPLQLYGEYRKHNPDAVAPATDVVRVWGSWTDACEAAGLIPRGSDAARWTVEHALQALAEVAAQEGAGHVSKDAYDASRDRDRHPSATTIVELAGGWNEAHEAAGLQSLQRGRRAYQRKWTDDQLWDRVTTYLLECEEKGRARTRAGFGEWLKTQPGNPSLTHIQRRLGPWTQLIRDPRVRPSSPLPAGPPPGNPPATEGPAAQRSVTVRIPEAFLDRLDHAAEARGLSRTAMVRRLILDGCFIQAPHHHRRRRRSSTELARTVAQSSGWWFDENDRLLDDQGLVADSIEDAAAALQDLHWVASPSPGLGVLWERMPADHAARADAVRERLDAIGRHPAVNALPY